MSTGSLELLSTAHIHVGSLLQLSYKTEITGLARGGVYIPRQYVQHVR